MKIRTLVTASVFGAGISVAGMSHAQQVQPAQKAQPQQPAVQVDIDRQNGQQPQGKVNDHTLASCLAIANQEEIAISKFAEEKSQNQKVKDFASMLEKEHRSFLQKLEKYAPEASRDGFLTETEAGRDQAQNANDQRRNKNGEVNIQAGAAGVKVENRDNQNRDNQAGQTAANDERHQHHAGHMMAMLNLHREIAQQCLSQAKEGMSKKDSAEFDKCFIGHQIAKHEGMKATLTVFERHATGDLRQIIADGLQTTEKHLKKAEDLMKQLEGNSKQTALRD